MAKYLDKLKKFQKSTDYYHLSKEDAFLCIVLFIILIVSNMKKYHLLMLFITVCIQLYPRICEASDISRSLKSKSSQRLMHKKGGKSGKKSTKSSKKSKGSSLSTKSSSHKVTSIPWRTPSYQPSFWTGPSNNEQSRSESPSSKASNDMSSAPSILSTVLAQKTPSLSPNLSFSGPSTRPSESSYKVLIHDIRVRIHIEGSSRTRNLFEYSNENLYFIMKHYISSILNNIFSYRFIELVLFMEHIASEDELIEVRLSGATLFRGEPRTTNSTLTELIRSSLEDDSFQNEFYTSSNDDTVKAVTYIEAALGLLKDDKTSNISSSDSLSPQLYTILFSFAGITALVLFRLHQLTRRGYEDDTSTCSPPERIYSTLSLGHSLDSVTCSSLKNNSNASSPVMGMPADDVSYESLFDNVCFHKVLGVHNDGIPEGRCDNSFDNVWKNEIATPKLSNFSKKGKN